MINGNVRNGASGSSRYDARVQRVVALISFCFALAACGLTPRSPDTTSLGSANRGTLHAASALPERGFGYVRARPGDDTRWGVPALHALIERAARVVAQQQPGGAPLVVGDLSARHGGRHSRHGSHQSGRDVDVLFYLVDELGRSVRGSGFYAFDARGASSVLDRAAPVHGLALFDTARNWAFVRALLLDEVPVQWIFCANGLKARLLAHAARHERDREALLRASYVLHEPSRGNPHRDHFHVRIACTAEERASGCVDEGPVWPWLRFAHEKPVWRGGAHDDETLVRALLEE
jgi:penicillin-insensitive murein DD-endopeptidase